MVEVVVIGAGLGGLSIGSMLTRFCQPLVLEQSAEVGGRAKVMSREGFLVDNGIHASLFAEKSAANDVLEIIGTRFKAVRAGIKFWEDGRFLLLLGKSPLSILRMKCLSRRSKLKLLRHLFRALREDVRLYPVSVREWLERIDAPQDIQNLLAGLCIALMACTNLERASIGEIVQFIRTAIRKRRAFGYPLGGWSSILNPMAEAVRLRGELRTNYRVDSILVEDGKAVGVRVGDEEIRANCVVCTAPAQKLPLLLDSPPDYLKKLKEIRPTAGVAIEYALHGSITQMDDVIITTNPPTLGWFTSNLGGTAPSGMQLLTTFSPIQAEDLSNQRKVSSQLRILENAYFEIFPEIEKKVKWKLERSFLVNGAELNIHQTRDKRPSVITPITNLFLVGDTTNAKGAGGEIACNSALECLELISRKLS
jgi:phytoene dehydrogenase-like protein